MKSIIISVFSAFLAFSAIAAADEKTVNVEEVKQQILQRLDKEMAMENQIREKQNAIMGQFRTCITGIKSEADFNACVAAKDDSAKKLKLELEKAFLDSKKKEIANQEKKLNEELKSAPKK